jgi:hypothetical protein
MCIVVLKQSIVTEIGLQMMFNQETIQMLRLIKKDDSLVQRFHHAELAADSSDDEQQSKMNRSGSSNWQSSTISGASSSNQGQWWTTQMSVQNRDLEADYIHDGIVSHMRVADSTKEDSTHPTLSRAWLTSMTSSMNDLLSEDEDLDPFQEVHMHVPGSKQLDTNVFVAFDLCY